MKNLESNNSNVDMGVESLVNSFEVPELDILKEYTKLPEYPDFETISTFIVKYGGGIYSNITEKISDVQDQIGISYQDFQKAILQALDHLHV